MDDFHFQAAVTFGRELVKSQDLDPVYTAISGANLDYRARARIVLAYSCVYHLGAAAVIATDKQFWPALEVAAVNKGLYWPRGHERRHWRGAQALRTVAYFKATYRRPEDVVAEWLEGSMTFSAVTERIRALPQYGPWVAFKVADMIERVLGCYVNFDDCAMGVYKEPRKAAALLLTGDVEAKIEDADVSAVVTALLKPKALGTLKAPPAFDRRVNAQEAETVLCKYKASLTGHYPMGLDSHEVYTGLCDPKWKCKYTDKMRDATSGIKYAHRSLHTTL